MRTTYQSHYNIVNSTDAILARKRLNERIKRMKEEGTYCDYNEPHLSYLNYNPKGCRECPNYSECAMEASRKMRNWNDRDEFNPPARKKKSKKPKTKRKCGCKK